MGDQIIEVQTYDEYKWWSDHLDQTWMLTELPNGGRIRTILENAYGLGTLATYYESSDSEKGRSLLFRNIGMDHARASHEIAVNDRYWV